MGMGVNEGMVGFVDGGIEGLVDGGFGRRD